MTEAGSAANQLENVPPFLTRSQQRFALFLKELVVFREIKTGEALRMYPLDQNFFYSRLVLQNEYSFTLAHAPNWLL